MHYDTLLVDHDEHFVTIIINRPAQLNALSTLVLRELADICAQLQHSGPRGVILTGAGDRAFAAGADIKCMAELDAARGASFGRLGQSVTEALEALPCPVIACVDGVAFGGGCELAMAADFIYATERAQFGQPEVKLGLIPGFGGCVRLARVVGPARAKELIYSGRTLTARDAERIGLVNHVFGDRTAMLAGARGTLAEIAARSPVAVTLCKHVLRNLDGKTTADQLAVEAAAFSRAFASEDSREGLTAFIARRPPAFIGR
jgi:enoyl-CoA hydratase